MDRLKNELYELVKSDSNIFDFIQVIALDGLSYCDIESPENEWMSPRFWLTLGYNPEEVQHNTPASKHLIHPDDVQLAVDNFNSHSENPDHPSDYVVRYIHRDGSIVWIRCRGIAIRNDEGKVVRMLSAHLDITKQREHEEKYNLLFNSIDEGFCIIEMIFDEQRKPIDYRFLAVNASFEKQTGLQGAIGKRMREFAPNHEEHWFEIYGKIALTGEPLRFENRATQLQRWYDVYAFRFGEPKNFQVAILFNDITKRKQGEEQLLALNNELEAFSYSIAHDLRAPLRSVNGYAGMLGEDFGGVLDKEGMRIVDNIKHNSSKMGQLIDDLLAFSRLGRQEVQLIKIDMNALTEDVIAEINKSLVHHAQIVTDHLHTVRGDYRLLTQVMFNLISNALKYSSKKENPLIRISSEEKEGEVVFATKDNGAGFDMRYSHKLFGVFQRLHKEREFEGTGIGLAIVNRIIAKHGGKVWAESKVNEGAAFYFTLPGLNENEY